MVYFGMIRQATRVREESVTLPEPARVADLLAALVARHGEDLREALFEADGQVKQEVVILAEGANVLTGDGVRTPLHAGDRTEIVALGSAVTGG